MRPRLFPILILSALLASCGGGQERSAGGDAADSPTPHPGEHTGAPSGGCADLSGSGQAKLLMKDNEFDPACFTVSSDQGIEIRNDGAALHSFTVMNVDLDLDVQPGATTTTERIGGALEAGTYGYHCKYHPEMTGEITVS